MDFVGQNNVCNFRNLKIWAERGLIHVEDMRDNSYESMSVRTMLQHMRGIQDMIRNSREQMKRSRFMNSQIFEEHQRMLEQMEDVCRQAQIQGMPSDASARRDLVRRRPETVCMPGIGSTM